MMHLRSKMQRRRTVCGKDIRAVPYTWAASSVTCDVCLNDQPHTWDALREHFSGMQSSGFWLAVVDVLAKMPREQIFTAADVKRAAGIGSGPYSSAIDEAVRRRLLALDGHAWVGSRRFKRYRRVV